MLDCLETPVKWHTARLPHGGIQGYSERNANNAARCGMFVRDGQGRSDTEHKLGLHSTALPSTKRFTRSTVSITLSFWKSREKRSSSSCPMPARLS